MKNPYINIKLYHQTIIKLILQLCNKKKKLELSQNTLCACKIKPHLIPGNNKITII